MSKRVLIIQEHLPHYRQRFFELLRDNLKKQGISLDLAYSPKTAENLLAGRLPWATPIPVHRWGAFSWQDVRSLAVGADLVIVQQESKYIANYLLSVASVFSKQKLAYWGHGKNFQSENASIIGERLKQFSSRFCDWWFAYNDFSADIVESLGFPRERITVVQNSIDTQTISQASQAVTPNELSALRAEMGLHSENVGVFTGGLYSEKRLKFLIESCQLVRKKVPDFELIIIGKGPDAKYVRSQAEKNRWIHYVGAKNDLEKIPYWKLSRLLLMPGLVGLVVLDSFALGAPMVTTDYPNHSPEISYLKDGVNGVIVSPWTSIENYANRVADLLRNLSEIHRLQIEALKAADKYSVEQMAENFATGLMKALAAPHLSRREMWNRRIRIRKTRNETPKISVVIRSVAPYICGFYDSLALRCKSDQLKILIGQRGTDWTNPWDASSLRFLHADHTFVNGRIIKKGCKTIFPSYKLLRELEKQRPSLVLTHEYSPLSLFAGLWARLQGIPWIIATDIGPDYRPPYPQLSLSQKLLHHFANHLAQGILALTPSAAKLAIKLDKPHLLSPHAIDTSFYLTPIQRSSTSNRVRIIAVGNFIYRKGYDLLFPALAELEKLQPNSWNLSCYGAGDTTNLRQLADTLKISAKISYFSFLGVNDLIHAYQGSDVFVLASRSDTYGIVAHEAAACGLPLIVSKYAGAANVLVEEGSNGYVVDPENAHDLATRIFSLSSDLARRIAYGQRSREIAEAWDVKRNAKRSLDWLTRFVEPKEERRHSWKTQ